MESSQTLKPLVGVGVIIIRNGLVLLGERKGSHGTGTWALPGGHLEFGEDIEDCARREVQEETGLMLNAIAMGPFTNYVFASEGKHYVTLFVLATSEYGEAEVLEPAKCSRWEWFRWSELPSPLFQPLQKLRESGYVPENAI